MSLILFFIVPFTRFLVWVNYAVHIADTDVFLFAVNESLLFATMITIVTLTWDLAYCVCAFDSAVH